MKIILLLIFISKGVALEFNYAMRASLLGGQTFIGNEQSNIGSLFGLDYIPSVRLTEQTTFILSYNGSYRGIKDLTELVGGGTLYQQVFDHLFTLKLIQELQNLKIKPHISYKIEWLSETKDEKIREGLFDYNKPSYGVDFEGRFKLILPTAYVLSFDYYKIQFPNFAILSTYGKENMGEKVLDHNSFSGILTLDSIIKKDLFLRFQYYLANRKFPDQRIIQDDGQYSLEKRKESFQYLLLRIINFFPKWQANVSLTYNLKINDSNQNHFDVERPRFIPDYYDYVENSISPEVNTNFGKIGVGIVYTLNYRKYKGRISQDASGNYQPDKTFIISNNFGISFSYKLNPALNILCNYAVRADNSNSEYKTVYRYNFNSNTYYLGVSYEL